MTDFDRDRIDEAIDRVAARMTRVDDDAELAARIMTSLPERSGWWLHWLMPRLAITAAVAIGVSLVVLRTFDEGSTDVLRTERPSAPAVARSSIVERPSNDRRTIVEPPLIVRRTIVEPPSNAHQTIEVPDFDRSLPSIDAVEALSLGSIAYEPLPEDALSLPSLQIADLPLTAESFSPR